MKKCVSCGHECEDSVRFCENCGTAEFICEKRCPHCRTVVKQDAKFCFECGARLKNCDLGAASDKLGNIAIGDKNVFAGDVVSHQENMKFFGNATIVKNEDETKKTVQCHVCGRNINILHSLNCPECREITCENCFDESCKSCKTCIDRKNERQEDLYINAFCKAFEDGIITIEERKQLNALHKRLGISAARAFELERQIKEGERSGETVSTLSSFVRVSLEKALDLLYNDGDKQKAYESLLPIYKRYPENEDVLTGFIAAAIKVNPNEAWDIIRQNQADVVGLHLAAIDYYLMNGDLDSADERLTVVDRLWPDNLLVACRKIMCYIAMYEKLQSDTFLMMAVDCLSALPVPQNKLESSWVCRVQYLVSSARGDDVHRVTRSYCEEHDLYFVIAHGEGGDADKMPEYSAPLQERDSRQFIETLAELAKKGHAASQCELANCYYSGNGVEEDANEAVKWYRKAAEQGYADAQYELADCYYLGNGIEEDYKEAVKWYQKSADQGHANAQYWLGRCYYNGIGVEVDYKEAEKWYRKAADQGHEDALRDMKKLLEQL